MRCRIYFGSFHAVIVVYEPAICIRIVHSIQFIVLVVVIDNIVRITRAVFLPFFAAVI
jgi:hypothetical protein